MILNRKLIWKKYTFCLFCRGGISHSLADIVVATPGRLVDHINKNDGFSLEHLRFLVSVLILVNVICIFMGVMTNSISIKDSYFMMVNIKTFSADHWWGRPDDWQHAPVLAQSGDQGSLQTQESFWSSLNLQEDRACTYHSSEVRPHFSAFFQTVLENAGLATMWFVCENTNCSAPMGCVLSYIILGYMHFSDVVHLFLLCDSLSPPQMPLQKLLFSATLTQNPEKLQQLGLHQPRLFSSVHSRSTTNPKSQERFNFPQGLTVSYKTSQFFKI